MNPPHVCYCPFSIMAPARAAMVIKSSVGLQAFINDEGLARHFLSALADKMAVESKGAKSTSHDVMDWYEDRAVPACQNDGENKRIESAKVDFLREQGEVECERVQVSFRDEQLCAEESCAEFLRVTEKGSNAAEAVVGTPASPETHGITHGAQQPRRFPGSFRPRKFCGYFKSGHCVKGSACRFAHAPDEMLAPLDAKHAHGVPHKPGDWFCQQCGDHQFAKNTRCRACGRARWR